MLPAAFVLLALGQISPAVESLPFKPEALRTRPKVELKVSERGKIVAYGGVPVHSVLEGHLRGERMAALRALSDAVVLVRASDGYQAAVSAAAVAMDPKGERYLLAFERDGQPLGEG